MYMLQVNDIITIKKTQKICFTTNIPLLYCYRKTLEYGKAGEDTLQDVMTGT